MASNWLSFINIVIYFLITIASHLDYPISNWIFLILLLFISFIEILSSLKSNTKKTRTEKARLLVLLTLNISYIIHALFQS